MKSLTITTCQAENTFEITRQLAAYLADRAGLPVVCREDISWQERYRLIDSGEIDIGWICGLPYVQRTDGPEGRLALLAAPVMAEDRYGARPCYFSDVVVRADSPFQQFLDLRGATWAINDPGSQSGYNVTRYHLAQLAETGPFFSQIIASGGHSRSLSMVLAGGVDASAIDSTLLDWMLAQRPSLANQIRIIEILGPSPIPPLVIQQQVPTALTDRIRSLLLHMDEDAHGRDLLAAGRLLRFTAVANSDYDPIRHMARQADTVNWSL